MDYSEMMNAIAEAEGTIRAADATATRIAKLLTGRLRKVDSGWTLAELKRELRDFNITTKCWNDENQ